MKRLYNTKSLIALSLGSMIAISGCNKLKDFGDTNVNPNDISDLKTYAILTASEAAIPGFATSRTGALYAQYISETQYPGVGLYAIPRNDLAGTYSGTLLNLSTIINKSTNPDEIAVARILTQYIFWNLTDNWGDIPYSEALKGVLPKYDKQQDIYKGIVTELKAANAQFTGGTFVRGDIINNGDINKWKKFANSLRMIMMLNLSKRFPNSGDYAAVEFRAALADGGITTNAENTKVVYPGGDFKNPFFLANETNRDDGESQNLYNLLNSMGDGRQAAFGSSSVAVPYGLKEADINLWIKNNINWSRVFSPDNRTDKSPVYIITAAETWLARAEAADRGWTSENATADLIAGVNASFGQWNLALPSPGYFTQSSVALSAPQGTGANIKNIAIQRYLAAFPDGRQAWSIYRRTGFPVLTPAPSPSNPAHTTIPRRWTYAQNEYDLNPLGVASAIANLVPAVDMQESRFWWDQ